MSILKQHLFILQVKEEAAAKALAQDSCLKLKTILGETKIDLEAERNVSQVLKNQWEADKNATRALKIQWEADKNAIRALRNQWEADKNATRALKNQWEADKNATRVWKIQWEADKNATRALKNQCEADKNATSALKIQCEADKNATRALEIQFANLSGMYEAVADELRDAEAAATLFLIQNSLLSEDAAACETHRAELLDLFKAANTTDSPPSRSVRADNLYIPSPAAPEESLRYVGLEYNGSS